MEFEPEQRESVEVETNLTLLALKKFLATNPDISEDVLQEMKQAVIDAELEIQKYGQLSQKTAEHLDSLL